MHEDSNDFCLRQNKANIKKSNFEQKKLLFDNSLSAQQNDLLIGDRFIPHRPVDLPHEGVERYLHE